MQGGGTWKEKMKPSSMPGQGEENSTCDSKEEATKGKVRSDSEGTLDSQIQDWNSEKIAQIKMAFGKVRI